MGNTERQAIVAWLRKQHIFTVTVFGNRLSAAWEIITSGKLTFDHSQISLDLADAIERGDHYKEQST